MAMLLAGSAAVARPRAVPVLMPVDARQLLLMDEAVLYDGRRTTPALGETRSRRKTTRASPKPAADGDDDEDEDEDEDEDDDEDETPAVKPAAGAEATVAAKPASADDDDNDDDEENKGKPAAPSKRADIAATSDRRPSAGGAPVAPTAVDDGDDDNDGEGGGDLKDRDVPYIEVDMAALAGYDDNPDENEDKIGSVTYGVEGKLVAGIGNDDAKLALAAEGTLVQTPSAPALDRYTAEAELEGRVGITDTIAATATAGLSRFALTDPAERTEYGSAGLEVAQDEIGKAALRVGAEQRRYRAAVPGATTMGSGAVRDTSDNEELRRLDYQRTGLEGEAEILGDGLFRPFVSGSLYRVRFPNPSDEIGDRAATDFVAAAGAKFAFTDDISLSLGGRYNRRDFRDPAQTTISHVTPTVSVDVSPGDWLDLTASYRREFAQPELTDAIARDARIVEFETALRPSKRWGFFVNADYEYGREVRANAYDQELELTGRIEYLVAPRVHLLVEAYRDTYRFYQDQVLDFAYDRTTLRGGVKSRF